MTSNQQPRDKAKRKPRSPFPFPLPTPITKSLTTHARLPDIKKVPSDSKTYILTGGFSGLGLAILTHLLTPKHPDTSPPTIHVLDLASTPPTLPATLPTATIHFYPNTDVTSRAGITATFDRILAQSPQIDGLINSAGICLPPTIGGIESDELFDRVLDVNLRGTWIVGTEFLKHVLNKYADAAAGNTGAAGGGGVHARAAIVNIASTAAFSPPPGMVAYATSKYAVLGLPKAWAKEYTSRGGAGELRGAGGHADAVGGLGVDGGDDRCVCGERANGAVGGAGGDCQCGGVFVGGRGGVCH
ncbi:SDR family NAD(P)-dependent oxidoreductase [Aspergillus aculeatinus CBS 121060]|uniref:NAD(P)-binding protein n=1 Tax=Aspergillus aculeatinus CBS 121060 TaxID=1448322 RepID=A0ACD1H1Y4_9EURO|nr:NAD(P)-binding protein [Aspergillus aculeatinus CBS 121060]RAH67597.1 NAD(P)-binding protein [Aspergillus aculeatinus CBS 121060]